MFERTDIDDIKADDLFVDIESKILGRGLRGNRIGRRGGNAGSGNPLKRVLRRAVYNRFARNADPRKDNTVQDGTIYERLATPELEVPGSVLSGNPLNPNSPARELVSLAKKPDKPKKPAKRKKGSAKPDFDEILRVEEEDDLKAQERVEAEALRVQARFDEINPRFRSANEQWEAEQDIELARESLEVIASTFAENEDVWDLSRLAVSPREVAMARLQNMKNQMLAHQAILDDLSDKDFEELLYNLLAIDDPDGYSEYVKDIVLQSAIARYEARGVDAITFSDELDPDIPWENVFSYPPISDSGVLYLDEIQNFVDSQNANYNGLLLEQLINVDPSNFVKILEKYEENQSRDLVTFTGDIETDEDRVAFLDAEHRRTYGHENAVAALSTPEGIALAEHMQSLFDSEFGADSRVAKLFEKFDTPTPVIILAAHGGPIWTKSDFGQNAITVTGTHSAGVITIGVVKKYSQQFGEYVLVKEQKNTERFIGDLIVKGGDSDHVSTITHEMGHAFHDVINNGFTAHVSLTDLSREWDELTGAYYSEMQALQDVWDDYQDESWEELSQLEDDWQSVMLGDPGLTWLNVKYMRSALDRAKESGYFEEYEEAEAERIIDAVTQLNIPDNQQISKYSLTNKFEAFAETFTAVMLDVDTEGLSDSAQALVDFMRRAIDGPRVSETSSFDGSYVADPGVERSVSERISERFSPRDGSSELPPDLSVVEPPGSVPDRTPGVSDVSRDRKRPVGRRRISESRDIGDRRKFPYRNVPAVPVSEREFPPPSKPVRAEPRVRKGTSLGDRSLEEYDKLTKKIEESGSVADLESLKEFRSVIQSYFDDSKPENRLALEADWESKNPKPVDLPEEEFSAADPKFDELNRTRATAVTRAASALKAAQKKNPKAGTRVGRLPKTDLERQYDMLISQIAKIDKTFDEERELVDVANIAIRSRNEEAYNDWLNQRDEAVAEQIPDISAGETNPGDNEYTLKIILDRIDEFVKAEEERNKSLADRLLEDYNKRIAKVRKSGLVSDIESLKELGRIIQTHLHDRGDENQALIRRIWQSENPEPVLTEIEKEAQEFFRTFREKGKDWYWDTEKGFFADDPSVQELAKELDSIRLRFGPSMSNIEFELSREREEEILDVIESKFDDIEKYMKDVDDKRLKRIVDHYKQGDKAVAEQIPDISRDDEVMLRGLVDEINQTLPKVAKYDGPSREESVAANGDLRPARQGLMPRRSVVEGVDRVLGLRSPEGFHLPVEIPVVDGGMDENGAVEHLADGGPLSEVPDDFLAQAIYGNVLTKDDLQAEINRAHQIMGYPGDPIELTDFEFAPADDEVQAFLSNLAGTEQRSGSKVPGRFIAMNEIEGDGINGIYMFYDRVSQQRIGIKYGTPKGKRTSYYANEDVNEVLAAHVAERLGFAYGSMRWGGPPPIDIFPPRGYDPGARPIVFELLHNYSNSSGDPADALSLKHGGESGYPNEASADSLISGLLLDLIIQNGDRHGGNFFTGETPSGEMAWFVPIDHGKSNMEYADTIVKPDWMGGLTGGMVSATKRSLERVKQVLANEQAGISDSLSRADILVAVRAAQASLREADSALEVNEAIGRILGAARFDANFELRRLTEGLASRLKEVTDIDPDDLLKLFENDRSV